MRFKFGWALALFAGLLSGPALAQTPAVAPAATASTTQPTDARQLWQLLDYVAVDYGGAVENGHVVSEGEYAEMLDFSANALQQAQALPAHADKARVAALVGQLRTAVQAKAAPDEVAQLAHQAAGLLVVAYPMPVAPAKAPDITKGSQLFQQICASCHGATGGGDGPAAQGLDPQPIAFSDAQRANARSLMALYQVTSQGVEGTSMVAFGALPEDDRWALAYFVGGLSYNDELRATGKALWQSDAGLRARFTDLAALSTTTAQSLAPAMPIEQGLLGASSFLLQPIKPAHATTAATANPVSFSIFLSSLRHGTGHAACDALPSP